MITIKNTQRTIKVNTARIKKTAEKILKELGYSDFDLGIWLTSNATIRKYNKDYRNKDVATDILSFPYHQLKAGQQPDITCDEDKNIGDLIIAPVFVESVRSLYKVSLAQRFDTLLIHGICHLLGYTHYDEENDEIMSKLEKKLAKKITQ